MKERYYIVLIILGLTLLSGFVLTNFTSYFANQTFVTKGTIESKQVTTIIPMANGQEYCYNITCSDGCNFEVKNSMLLSNCSELYDYFEENKTYTFTTWFDINTGKWNIIEATKIE